jgi:hypothetical protein
MTTPFCRAAYQAVIPPPLSTLRGIIVCLLSMQGTLIVGVTMWLWPTLLHLALLACAYLMGVSMGLLADRLLGDGAGR